MSGDASLSSEIGDAGESISLTAVPAGIGVLREGPLHAALKQALAVPGDRLEVSVGRFVIDLVRADGELVEVQTGGFGALGAKLDALLDEHRFRIVYPIAGRRRVVRVDATGQVLRTRLSSRRGNALELFDRLVSFPSLVSHPHLTLEVVLVAEDHIRAAAPVRGRRRTRDPGHRRLVEILQRIEIADPVALVGLLGPLPAAPFTTQELAAALHCRARLAQRIVYCLRALGLVQTAGKRGQAPLHRLADPGRENVWGDCPPGAGSFV
jgi:hypothetical protein